MTYDYKTVLYAESQRIATITLNRADKRNAISYELIDDLIAALKQAADSSAQVVILTGAGKAFCSGMDMDNLKQLTGRTHEQNIQDSETMASLFRALYDFPKPTIAAVNGPAIAGGTGLATLCDFTLAVPEAKFGYTEVRIGFVPAIVSSFLIANIGEKRARDLLLTGRIFSADEAHKLGLVNEIVAPEELIPRAQELAAQLLENSPASLQATKKLLSSYTREQLDRQVKQAVQGNAGIRQTADFKEGITAFREKRKPTWTGKERTVKQRSAAKPNCASATPRPTRWAWCITPTSSYGLRLGAWSCCGNSASSTARWRAKTIATFPWSTCESAIRRRHSMMMRSWCARRSRMCAHRCCTSVMKSSASPIARCWRPAKPCTSLLTKIWNGRPCRKNTCRLSMVLNEIDELSSNQRERSFIRRPAPGCV
jgi:methylglutaconyl-CoA hydratase